MNKNHVYLKKQSGLALILALIFLQIMAILGLFAIDSYTEMEKMSRLTWQQNNTFYQAEQELHIIEKRLLKSIPNCLIQTIPENELITKPFDWWHTNACSAQNEDFEYHYVIEKLDLDPCAQLNSNVILQNGTPEYLRITLLTLNKKNESKEFLQSTVLTLDNTNRLICDGIYHKVVLGRQMWRELR